MLSTRIAALAAAGAACLVAGCGGSGGHPAAARAPAAAAAAAATPAASAVPGCVQFGLVRTQITAAIPAGETGTALEAALNAQGLAWSKSLGAAGATAESGPQAGTGAAVDIDGAASYVADAVLAASLGNPAETAREWLKALAALATAAGDCPA